MVCTRSYLGNENNILCGPHAPRSLDVDLAVLVLPMYVDLSSFVIKTMYVPAHHEEEGGTGHRGRLREGD